jgi:putative ABC transport system permease protein
MFENDLKIALRNLWRRRSFSILNILGLAIGIGVSLLIFVVIRNERSFDTWHTRKDRIYRVGTDLAFHNGSQLHVEASSILLPDAIRKDFPQFEKVAAVSKINQAQFAIPPGSGEDEKLFEEKEGVFYVEPAFFEIFDFPWVAGTPSKALKDLYTMAISRSIAQKWFGGDPLTAIGKTVLFTDKRIPLTITGILQDPPANTDIALQMALSYATYRALNAPDFADEGNWGSMSSASECFVLLSKGEDIHALETRLPAFSKRHYQKSDAGSSASTENIFLPLKDQHFDEVYGNYGKPAISLENLWALGLIGIFLIVVACINFINLCTAQSVNRSKEIGVRKVLGSNRPQLLRQFLQETGLITFIALILACILAELALPFLTRLVERQLSPGDLWSPVSLLFLLGIGLLVTFLAGFYPAMVLSGFDPISAIKNKVRLKAGKGLSLRRGLVVLQFVIAQLLIIGTLVVIKQMAYFQNRPMGFDRKAITFVDLPGTKEARQNYTYLKDKITRVPGVLSATLCDSPPSTNDAWNTDFNFDHRNNKEDFNITLRYADTDYLRTFNMHLAAGRLPYPSDTMRELLINETAVRMLGLKSDAEALGKTIQLSIQVAGEVSPALPVVGVIKDFNDKPLNRKDGISPIVMATSKDTYTTLAIRMDPREVDKIMPELQTAYSGLFAQHLFEATYFDDMVVSFYHVQDIVSKLFKVFAVLAIFISCLGLYGLVAFMAAQKTKEVGIRKVLGASVRSIVYLFSKEFTLLLILAFVVAAPLAYYFMSQWLNGFYYRTTIGWEVFAAAMVLSVLIAWATVGYRAVRAAVADPLKAIKYE